VRVAQCVSAERAVGVSVFVYLRNSCNQVTGRREVRLVRPAQKVAMQNDGDLADVIMLSA